MSLDTLSLYEATYHEASRNLTHIKIGAFNEARPAETIGYVAGSIEHIPQGNAAKLLHMKVEDERMRGKGIAGQMLRGFAVSLRRQGVTHFESQLVRPEALKAVGKVFPDEAILIYDYFSKQARRDDGSLIMFPLTVEQALLTGDRMREGVPREDWVCQRYLGAVVNFSEIDTSSWPAPEARPWEEW